MKQKKSERDAPKRKYNLRTSADSKKRTHEESVKAVPAAAATVKVDGTFRGHPDKRPVKFIFINSNGNICLAPSLTWFANTYHLSKGNVSDVYKKRISLHMGWTMVPIDKISNVLTLIGKTEPVTGKYTTDKDTAIKFMLDNGI